MRNIIISNLIRRVVYMKNDVSHLGRREVQQGCGWEFKEQYSLYLQLTVRD